MVLLRTANLWPPPIGVFVEVVRTRTRARSTADTLYTRATDVRHCVDVAFLDRGAPRNPRSLESLGIGAVPVVDREVISRIF